MERAYDQMKWNFIFQVLRRFGFTEKWIQLANQCLSIVTYSVLLNGTPFGLITPERGLRQGDPLSPFLFILGTEVLSRMISRAEVVGQLHGIKISLSAPPISHLRFTDDTMIFARATSSEASTIANVLHSYGSWSGQSLNQQKSSVFSSKNVNQSLIVPLALTLGIGHSSQPGKYLGLPFILPRLKRQAHLQLKAKLLKRVSGWRSKLLSQAGRACLIRFVLSFVPIYFMSSFLLPNKYWMELDSILRKFWWGFPQDKLQNFIPRAWSSICWPKTVGGRFRLFHYYNKALLSKRGWQICNQRNKFWVQVLRAKYCGPNAVSVPNNSTACSWFWQGILQSQPVLAKGMIFSVGEHSDLNCWRDPWVPDVEKFKPTPREGKGNHNLNLQVKDLLHTSSLQCNESLIREVCDESSIEAILYLAPPQHDVRDSPCWLLSKDNTFSVKSAYFEILKSRPPPIAILSGEEWGALWRLKIPDRIKHFLW